MHSPSSSLDYRIAAQAAISRPEARQPRSAQRSARSARAQPLVVRRKRGVPLTIKVASDSAEPPFEPEHEHRARRRRLTCNARTARPATTTAPTPSSKRHVLARCRDVASTRAAATPPPLAVLLLDKGGHRIRDGEAAALVLATQEFVANAGGRPLRPATLECSIAGRTGSLGRVGQRGCWRSEAQFCSVLDTTTRSLRGIRES